MLETAPSEVASPQSVSKKLSRQPAGFQTLETANIFFARCARTGTAIGMYVSVAHLTGMRAACGLGRGLHCAGHSFHSHSKLHVLVRSLSSNSRLRGGGTCCVQMCTAQRACAGHTKITRRAGQW